MVRINLIPPKRLADQHLVAEYNEMLMLLGYVRRYPEPINIPPYYKLGKGHMSFFKDKLAYIKARHELIKKEMRRRGFKPVKTIILSQFPKPLRNDWKPKKKDFQVIKARITEKIKKKPGYYRYYSKPASQRFLLGLLNE